MKHQSHDEDGHATYQRPHTGDQDSLKPRQSRVDLAVAFQANSLVTIQACFGFGHLDPGNGKGHPKAAFVGRIFLLDLLGPLDLF